MCACHTERQLGLADNNQSLTVCKSSVCLHVRIMLFFFFLMEKKKKSVNNAIWLQVHKYIGAATENCATAECLFEMCVAYKPCNS